MPKLAAVSKATAEGTRPIRVGVLGAAGRMGRTVCEAVASQPDMLLVAAVDPGAAGRKLIDLVNHSLLRVISPDLLVGQNLDALIQAQVDVAVDFSLAEAARVNLLALGRAGVHSVVGTSGLTGSDLAALEAAFADGGANCVVAPNFAIGAVLLVHLSEIAGRYMDGAEIIEMHHDGKVDAPSGTAVFTAERIAASRAAVGLGSFAPDATERHNLGGSRGADGSGGVRVHAVRLPGVVAHQEVIFGAPGQSLTLRHDSYDRQSFMPGVVLAIREVAHRPGLTVGLDRLMGLDSPGTRSDG